jgi:uncharacterized membrane protein YukC
MNDNTKHAAGDVSEQYAHPEDILKDERLDRDRKIQLLKEWEQDLRQLMVASEENMSGNVTGQPAESLKAVHNALEALEPHDDQERPVPGKQG